MKAKIHLIWLLVVPVAVSAVTDVKLYDAFTPAVGQARLTQLITHSGQCQTRSQCSPRSDAWQCQAAGKHYDPCYVRLGTPRNAVICPVNAWSNTGVVITLKHDLPQPAAQLVDVSRQMPWLIELTQGDHCWRQGAHYQCESGQRLNGHLHRCKTTWEAMGGPSVAFVQRAWY